ncbi:MAG: PAS domain-containing sensor histidine kinase [Propionibacteriaceae bacterium]|nr:PAS domain-containing sensor histidine kinase [Propionibacteriaceae bacterium]
MSSGSAPASANSTPSSWTGSVSSDTSHGEEGMWRGIRLWWAEFSLQTKLLAIATLVVSLMMTSITFFALNGIQRDAVMNDTRYARDLGLLLAGNVTELVAEGHDRELANVAEQFWRSSRSLRYIFFADPEGVVYLGIPISGNDADTRGDLRLNRRLEFPSELRSRPKNPLVRQHLTPDGQVTDVFVPLIHEGRYLGVLALGVNPNDSALASASLTREVTVAVFISIWVLVILGAVFNALTITRPVKELLRGVRSIADGDFQARIGLPVGGELGELLDGFNAMASQLQDYDAANIEELQAAQVKQASLIATMADGAVLLDEKGQIVLANPTSRRLFRWEGRNLEGQDFLNALPDLLAVELHDPLDGVLNQGRDSNELRSSIGEPPRTLRFVLQAVREPTGENLKGIAVTMQDLTREVELNAAQSRFISNVSHELRTPLFNIKSYVETLYEMGDQLSDKDKQEFLGVANSETDRLTRLVNDVLDLSRLESHPSVQFSELDLRPGLEQTLRSYQLNASDKKVQLDLEASIDLPDILGNWDLLLQVFDNLVGNALKFSRSGSRIVLRAYAWPDSCFMGPLPEDSLQAPQCELVSPLPKLRVEISDTGYGISEDKQQRIFERFYRVENAVHTEVGTGLGLSIVRGILEKHSSVIRMASEPDVGTTFWFDLPLAQSDQDEIRLQAERQSRFDQEDLEQT